MKKKNQEKLSGSVKIPFKDKSLFIVTAIAILVLATYLLWPSPENIQAEIVSSPPPVVTSPVSSADNIKLVGRWQRSDGGYIIELKNPTPEGLIDASYFNPSPIHVGKSAWQNKAGKLMVMIELQDQNYPGSIYTLEYQPQGDRLTGIYFQAVEKVSYNVEFTRSR